MNTGRTVFAQLLEHLPLRAFRACVARYHGDRKVRAFSCLDQFLTLAFAQLTGRESLRDVETALGALRPKLYHMGFRCGPVKRSTLADANETRDWRIYYDFAQVLIAEARTLYANDPLGPAPELATLWDTAVYALDVTTIRMCLTLCPWATFRPRRHGGAIKLHTLLDVRGNIPTVVHVTAGSLHETRVFDRLVWEPGAFYLLDRGYGVFARLHEITDAGAFFVTRAKRNMGRRRVASHPVPPEAKGGRTRGTSGVTSDTLVECSAHYTHADYPTPLRLVRYYEAAHDRYFVFMTNNMTLPALTIAALYERRWQVELFFRWIKQHLRLRAFYGTTENAVFTQVWSAIAVYVLVAVVRKRLQLPASLYTILQILSVTLAEKTPLPQLLTEFHGAVLDAESANQLSFFNL
jgi:hypothetical protein